MKGRVPELLPIELQQERAGPQPPKLLDVREPEELQISSLGPDAHISLAELPSRLGELDPNVSWVVICRSGARSAEATRLMLAAGFTNVRNLAGGINGYAKEVDPTLRTY